MDLIPFDAEKLPEAFGLVNNGVICYFNSVMQALLTCTSFTETIRNNHPQTRLGQGFHFALTNGKEFYHQMILKILIADIRDRRPNTPFGRGQESASETLLLLIEMIEPPNVKIGNISRLFMSKVRYQIYCKTCKKIVSTQMDYSLNFFNGIPLNSNNSIDFAQSLRHQKTDIDDYQCDSCNTKTPAIRYSDLARIPNILFCMFNIYDGPTIHQFPEFLEFNSLIGKKIKFRLISQIEHSGGLNSGHYWSRCLRKNGNNVSVKLLNDNSYHDSYFSPSPETYIVVYHYCGEIN
jgi:ubiquitin C-terminal hydrolase